MDFRISADQQALIDGIRDFLGAEHGVETVRQLDGNPRPEALRRKLVEMGLPALLVPEADGGLGLDLVTGALVAMELGRACVADPVADTALIAAPWLASHPAVAGDWLARIAAGDALVALAHPANPWVADLDLADALIGGGGVKDVPPAPAAIASVDPLRRLFATPAVAADDRLLDLGVLMTAGQLIGLADTMLKMAVDYATQRRQFGQPIGSFQAVKHHLATAAVRIEFAKPVLLRAAQAQQDGLATAAFHVSHAKLAATDAAIATAETAIQVHGAMGYTYEVDLHFWMKRSWALAGAWGDRNFHLRRISAGVTGGTLPIGPSNTFTPD